MRTKKQNPARQASLSKLQLLQEIEYLKLSLETANSNFENVSDPDLIDSYIYEMNAISFRYKYLLRQMKVFENSVTASE